MTGTYPSPLQPLFTLGEAEARQPEWPDYLALGLTPEHVPELIRLATDLDLWNSESASSEVWGPLHAYRALGQLRAEEAAEALTKLMGLEPYNDWVMEEIPVVLAMIGRAAIPDARALLARSDVDEHARWGGATALRLIAESHPDARDEAVGALIEALRRWPEQGLTVNAFLVWELADARAVEAAPLMQAAFEADAVDLEIGGDWEDVQVSMGLIPARTYPRPRLHDFGGPSKPRPAATRARARPKTKKQRKDAKAARRRNRRK
jgi:hypothetical protein